MAARMHCPAWLLLGSLSSCSLWCLLRRLRLCQEADAVAFQSSVSAWQAIAWFGSIWPTQVRTQAQATVPTLLGGPRSSQLQSDRGLSRGRAGGAVAPLSRCSSNCCWTFSSGPGCVAVSGMQLPARWNWSASGGLTDGGSAGRRRGRQLVAAPVAPQFHRCPLDALLVRLLRVHLPRHVPVGVGLAMQMTMPTVEASSGKCSCLVKESWQRHNSTCTPYWPMTTLLIDSYRRASRV